MRIASRKTGSEKQESVSDVIQLLKMEDGYRLMVEVFCAKGAGRACIYPRCVSPYGGERGPTSPRSISAVAVTNQSRNRLYRPPTVN